MIGGSFVRGVSGGERKRVCIGNEIIINPSLLFLDEPTSGLDSTTALRIIQILQDIAEVLVLIISSKNIDHTEISSPCRNYAIPLPHLLSLIITYYALAESI